MADTLKPDAMEGFVRDQVAAARVLREESQGEERKDAASRRVDACHLAMRYYDTFGAGCTPSVETVLRTARQFEQFLVEP